MLKYEDIHLSDSNKRNTFITDMKSGSFTSAQSIVSANNMKYKCSIAAIINELADKIEQTERISDASFKTDKIVVSASAPTLQSGQIYFELSN